jgi:hypothetical protein
MHVTGVRSAQREQYLAQVEKITNSKVLHGSESLCKLLRYLADHALEHPGVALKEYQIATEVFGRPTDFDPQSDSAIRVQAGRLRLKLAEYYSSEGAGDQIAVELPKGSYVLSFHPRTPSPANVRTDATAEAAHSDVEASTRSWALATFILAGLLIVAMVAVAMLWANRNSPGIQAVASGDSVPEAFKIFWNSFVTSPEEPLVVFSNGAFVGRPETGLRYYDPGRDGKDVILDHYTGVGEVLAVHDLDHVFGQLHGRLRVKRGSLFTLYDAKNNDLIFVGSPAENLTLRELPSTQDFVFQRLPSGPRKGDLALINIHPQADEAKEFLATPSDKPLVEDYAVIGLERGLNPARSVLILAGTTTMGTQAAAEFVCRQNSIEQLLLRLSVSNTGQLRPFEAVLRVKVVRGVPVESQVVALHKTVQ